MKMVQLTGQEQKLPGQLSGGQQQRVAIARAIVIEPPLILMDEPLSNLDAKLRLETRAEIRRIHRELGRATIYVTHDQDEALSLADRIVVMKDGGVQQIAPPQEVYAQPANLDVARFMGYRNVLELDVEREAGGQVTLAGPGIRLTGTRKLPLDGPPGRGRDPARRTTSPAKAGATTRSPARSPTSSTAAATRWSTSSRPAATAAARPVGAGAAHGRHVHVHVPVERALVYPVALARWPPPTATAARARSPFDRTLLLVVPAALFMLLLFVYPFLYGLWLSFTPKEGGALANYAHFFTTDNLWPTIWTTLRLALPATLINVGFALPIAFKMRVKTPYQRW